MTKLVNKDKRKTLRKKLYEKFATDGVTIPQTIKDLRRIMGLNQSEFAARIGISLSALRRIEQGHDNFTIETLNKILQPFSVVLVVKKDSGGLLEAQRN